MKKILTLLISLSLFALLSCDGLLGNLDNMLPDGMETEQDFEVEVVNSNLLLIYKIEFKDDNDKVIGECVTTINPTNSKPISTVMNVDLVNAVSIVIHTFLGEFEFPIDEMLGKVLNSIPGGSPMLAFQINPLDLLTKGKACLKLYLRKNKDIPFEQDKPTEINIGDTLCISADQLGLGNLLNK